jgi:Tat protein secretion system quality control protein TatD with DNase activity
LADPAYAGKIESVIEDAAKNGVELLLSNSMDYDTSVQTISLAKQYETTDLAAIGLHPWTIVGKSTYDLANSHKEAFKLV